TGIHIHTEIHTHRHTHSHRDTYTQAYTLTHTHTEIHTHRHTHSHSSLSRGLTVILNLWLPFFSLPLSLFVSHNLSFFFLSLFHFSCSLSHPPSISFSHPT